MIYLKQQAVQHKDQAEPPARPNLRSFASEIDSSDFKEELRTLLFLLSEPNF